MNENRATDLKQWVQFGEAQTHKNIAVLPLIPRTDGEFQYRTLGEALSTHDITITEISMAGSVPELMVVNRGNTSVLLIDGEELAGAKQNRVLNSSILLKPSSETRIPVSCTEQGRWSYASKSFIESGNVLARQSRARKSRSVYSSLESHGTYKSDQGEVWNTLAHLQAKADVHSPTHAMSDVYRARADALLECEAAFKPLPNQAGLLVLIDGKPVGLDLVSLTSAYARLHPKLLRSYVIEAVLEPKHQHPAPDNVADAGKALLDEIAASEERRFPSVGYGTDHRYKAPRLGGAALVHENEIIHAAFFRLDDVAQPDPMAPLHRRQRWFVE